MVVAMWTTARPKTALSCPAITRLQIINRRFIHRHIAASHYARADNLRSARASPTCGGRRPHRPQKRARSKQRLAAAPSRFSDLEGASRNTRVCSQEPMESLATVPKGRGKSDKEMRPNWCQPRSRAMPANSKWLATTKKPDLWTSGSYSRDPCRR